MSISAPSPLATAAQKIGSSWWILAIVGIAWIVIGFVVLRFDTSTVYVISIVFGILLLLSAGNEVFRAVITPGGWRVWHTIFAILLVIAAIIAFVNPGATFESLALVIGLYFVFIGTYDIISSLFSIAISPIWWLQLLSGIAELILGFLASSSFSSSVLVLVTYVSVLAIFRGIAEISAAFTIRHLTQTTN
ncbi:HdeD family acid-resistance protein [Leifsonia sp. NPDC058248]|uniref:HdeD family acid-resistance protein n=1 Tax=Leifsonia sp. NPDC058248 TaxID=3346402 RepID=UPI0036DCE4F3